MNHVSLFCECLCSWKEWCEIIISQRIYECSVVSVKSFKFFIFKLTRLPGFFVFCFLFFVFFFSYCIFECTIQVDLPYETLMIHLICVVLLPNSSPINSSFQKSSPTSIVYWIYSKTQWIIRLSYIVLNNKYDSYVIMMNFLDISLGKLKV